MSPDLYFALTLIVKMAVTAGFLLVATVTAERAGPLIGGLVATLPISAGPVYIFLAIDHDAHFIAQSALGSLVTNAANVLFAVTYALLAQKRSLPVCLAGALQSGSAVFGDRRRDLDACRIAIAFNVASSRCRSGWCSRCAMCGSPPCSALVRPGAARRHGRRAGRHGGDVQLPIGAAASGSLAVFPIVLSSIMIILHRRIGGQATAAISPTRWSGSAALPSLSSRSS